MAERHVRHKNIVKSDASAALVAGWARAIAKMGKGNFADAVDADVKTVSRAMAGESLPELHTALASLLADPTSLDELFALYGFEVRPRVSAAANDLDTVAGLSHLVGRWVEALADGHRSPRETCVLADTIRPIIQALGSICSEADRIRGVA